MKVYADYDFYVCEYGSEIPVDAFEKYAKEASAYIRYLTLKRSDNFNGEELKYATCAVAELYFNHEKTQINGRVITSENNDGYAVSYATSAEPEEAKRNAAYSAAKKWLSGTGLLRRGAKRVNKC